MRWLGLMVFVAMTACGAPAVVGSQLRTASAPDATFAGYRSFAFRVAAPPAMGPAERPSATKRRLRTLIAARLMLKGYVEQPGGIRPDFLVRFQDEGALVVEAFDTQTEAKVFRATSEAGGDPGKASCLDNAQLRDDVARLLATFPERSDAAGLAEISALSW